jgi:hypothetical protein
MITILGYEVPNTIDELTIEQFDRLNNIEAQKDLDSIEKWIMKFVYLGIPEEAFEDITLGELQKHMIDYNADFVLPTEKQYEVVIDGYTYTAKEEISAKEMSLIEKSWKHNLGNFSADSLAIIFKRNDLTRNEHYTLAHLKQKAKLFREMKASLAVPFVAEIIKSLTTSVDNALTKELERADSTTV